MNPMGGIDQQIQQRKMQFKDNPQQLQQRYGQNKELLDLLALQEISKEQQQRSQRMQMEAQQNTATVADQMQQEVLQGKKAEMAQGLQGIKGLRERTKDVGGALAQKQQQQQQRMQQQQGQQPQRPPQQQQRPQGQPMMAAAGGLMTQAAPNIDPRYFEGGGIVAFEAGGRVQALIEEYRKKTAGAKNLSDEEILDRLETARPTEVAEYRKKMYGTTGKSDAEIEQEIGESFSGKLKAARTADLSDRGRAPDPMSMGLGMGMGMGSPTLEPLAAERMEYTGAVAPAEKVVAEETVADEARAVGEEAGTAAADETELSTLEQVLKGAEQFGLPDDSAAPDAPLSQAKPVDDYLLNPAAQAARQGDRQREAFSANEARLNMGMPTGGLETLDRSNLAPTQGGRPLPGAPEMLRRAPEKELTLEQEFEALRRKQLADLKRDEEGLKDTRSNTRRLLDRLTDAAVNASKRPAATTNRGALASLGLGVSEAVRAEEAERKEGLADIAKRRGELIDRQLAGQLGLAQISQGDKGLDIQERTATTAEATLAESTRQFNERLASTEGQFDQQLAVSKQQWEGSNALAVLEAQRKTIGEQATINLKEAELCVLILNSKTVHFLNPH